MPIIFSCACWRRLSLMWKNLVDGDSIKNRVGECEVDVNAVLLTFWNNLSRGHGMLACLSWPGNPWQALSIPHGHRNFLCIWIIILQPTSTWWEKNRNGLNYIFYYWPSLFQLVTLEMPAATGISICLEICICSTYPFSHVNSYVSYTLFGLCFFLLKYIFWEEFYVNVYDSASGMWFWS